MYSRSIQNLIHAFTKFPTVGQRTAERFVFFLLKSGKKNATELTLALKQLLDTIQSCEVCWNFSDHSPCPLCADEKREKNTICVVKEPQDMETIERTGLYRGRYHILRGTLHLDDDQVKQLKIRELFSRVEHTTITEIIFALNPDMEGETTMMYLKKEIEKRRPTIHITRLAKGLAMGSDLQYADEITLASAFQNRTKMHTR